MPPITIPTNIAGVPHIETLPKLSVILRWSAGGRNAFTTKLMITTAAKTKIAPTVAVTYRISPSPMDMLEASLTTGYITVFRSGDKLQPVVRKSAAVRKQ